MYNFKELSDWLPIEEVSDIDDPSGMKSVVYFNDITYYLDDFVGVHNSIWIDGTNYPQYIHGMEFGSVDNPLFIHVDPTGNFVKLYELIGEEQE